ncbi:MAG: SH3 domain-containing protein [Oscillospiraceae bacterium]|jgi:hypothetical protein|nr:SH3 domain-containing protein [Oscillospiraceae bacterium]
MRKWGFLVVLMLIVGLMGNIATAEEPDSPVVVVDLPELEDMQPLYAEPSDTSAVLGEYPRGTNAWLLGDTDGFSHIRLGDGTEGYIPSDKALAMEPFTHLVTPELARQRQYWGGFNVNLRIFRLYHHPLYTSPYGAVRPVQGEGLTVLAQFGGWMHLRTANGQEGFIPCVELDIMMAPHENPERGPVGFYFVCHEDARMRTKLYAQPDESSAVLGEYYNGTQMEGLELVKNPDDTVDWIRVRIGDLEGYVLLDGVSYFRESEVNLWSFG